MEILFITLFSSVVLSQEICDNGIDDDGDGLIDLNDPDCNCSPTVIPSLIPNPSFEVVAHCPTGYSDVAGAQGWSQATSCTSDYFNCGYNFGAATAAGLVPPPDGTGYLGTIFSNGWQEYVGTCLTQPMNAGQNYTLQFSIASTPIDNQGGVCNGGTITYPPIDITIYGLSTCPSFPINTSTCPPGWSVIGTATYTPIAQWGTLTINMVPSTNINSIIIGSPCTLPSGYGGSPCYAYFYYDNLILQQSSYFNSISQTGQWCDNNIALSTTPDPNATFQWYLGGVALPGETGTSLNVSTNNYGAGTYTVASFSGGSCATSTDSVVIPDFPVANFGFTNQCNGTPISFADSSTVASGSITNWQWDFGDGLAGSTTQNPSSNYSSPGTYNVSLIVTSDVNCTDTIVQTVESYALPTSDFSWGGGTGFLNGSGNNAICLNDQIQFNNNSINGSGQIVTTNWNFGDGSPVDATGSPTHVFPTPGTYNVELLVSSNYGCSDSVTIPVVVNDLPVAAFTSQNDCYNVAAVFQDNSTPTGQISTWSWDFGDGNGTSNVQNPSYLYGAAGQYNVTLTIQSDSGCLDTTSQLVNRFNVPVANFIASNVCFGDSTCFNDASSINNDVIVGWVWNLGDGSPFQSGSSFCHQYTSDGSYDVSMIVSSANGCIDDTTISVDVYPIPNASFTFDSICENSPPTNFYDNSTINSGQISFWNWTYNQSVFSSTQNSSYNFSAAGIYNVQLQVMSDQGCIDSVTNSIIVYPKPTANLTVDNPAGCVDLCVNFTNLSSPNSSSIINNYWNLDISTSTDINPSICYNDAGSYSISLIVENDLHCFDTVQFPGLITAYPLPVADFIIDPVETSIYNPEVNFTNMSGNIQSWVWNFGDGNTDSVNYSTTNIYADSGTYYVSLEVWNSYGCFDSIVKPLRIDPEFALFIPNSFTPDNDGINETFFISGFGLIEDDFQFYIFDRWGEVIYYTQTFQPWDGTYKAVPAEEGVYVYKVSVRDVFNKLHEFTGHVTLLR